MTHYNRTIINQTPENERIRYNYYPDYLPYAHNQREFDEQWQSLVNARWVYSNGLVVRKAGFFRYLFESFKGLFGYANHCDDAHVQMGLRKFSFFGYLKGFTRNKRNFTHYPLPEDIFRNIKSERKAQTSRSLQASLILCYNNYRHLFHPEERAFQHFGSSMIVLECYAEISKIDGQNKQIIKNAVSNLLRLNKPDEIRELVHNFQELGDVNWLLAEINSNRRPFQFSLELDQPLINKFPMRFIQYFLYKNQFENAGKLIDMLSTRVEIERIISHVQCNNIPFNFLSNLDSTTIEKFNISFIKHFLSAKQYEDAEKIINNLVDSNKIRIVIDYLDTHRLPYPQSKGTAFAKLAAEHLGKKAKERQSNASWFSSINPFDKAHSEKAAHIRKALELDPNCEMKEPKLFLDFYLAEKKPLPALKLLEKIKDRALVEEYSKKKPFNDMNFIKEHVAKDSLVASVLVEKYLRGKYRKDHLELAESLFTDFDKLHPAHAFEYFVEIEQYEKAFKLFVSNDQTNFKREAMEVLANYYDQAGEDLYEEGFNKQNDKNWQGAKQDYLNSMLNKARSYRIIQEAKQKEEFFTHKRLYAQLLINMMYETEFNEEILEKAINDLYQCRNINSEKDGEFIIKALSKGLMLQIDNLCKLVSHVDHKELINHVKTNKDTFIRLLQSLDKIITLLENNSDEETAQHLAKAYYLKADLIDYFKIDKIDKIFSNTNEQPRQLFKKAMQTQPKNPFYSERYAQCFSQKSEEYKTYGHGSISGMKQAGASPLDLMRWEDERWKINKIVQPNLRDIHYISIESHNIPQQSPSNGWFSL